jgi:transcriptional regulator GlxA family with amidase domain
VNRRGFLAASGVAAAGASAGAFAVTRGAGPASTLPSRPLPVPADGTIRVAFVLGDGFNVIDVAGAWETFQDAAIAHAAGRFELYTVGAARDALTGSGGLSVQPTYAFDDAPAPHVVVIPAHGPSSQTVPWLQDVATRADLVMSVCTGAFVLADTGLLDGKTATTHHGSWDDFERAYPKIELVRGTRFVEHEHVATAGGLTSGIDLALRTVERYLGRDAADRTAAYMEYTRAPVGGEVAA